MESEIQANRAWGNEIARRLSERMAFDGNRKRQKTAMEDTSKRHLQSQAFLQHILGTAEQYERQMMKADETKEESERARQLLLQQKAEK